MVRKACVFLACVRLWHSVREVYPTPCWGTHGDEVPYQFYELCFAPMEDLLFARVLKLVGAHLTRRDCMLST